jgi:hypothetical protein
MSCYDRATHLAIYRELAAANPGRYHPDLGVALANLGVRLYQRGLDQAICVVTGQPGSSRIRRAL